MKLLSDSKNYFGNGVRWKIVLLLCFASGLNYIDRNTLAILATTIQKELNWSDSDYANITSLFVLSYTIMYAFSGRLVDLIGTKKGYAYSVGSWSLVNAMHAIAGSVGQFSIARIFLGITESANFPAGVKSVTEWFPLKERALAIGIFNAGSAIGAAVAVPVVSFIAIMFGWRMAFIVTGILGLIWLLLWLKYYHLPENHPGISDKEKKLIEEDTNQTGNSNPQTKISLKKLLLKKESWGCFSARIFIDPVTYFLLFWIPKYLQDEQGLTLQDIGSFAWIPYIALGVGTILGGAIPKMLIDKAGWSLNRSRKTVMFIASLLILTLCLLLNIKLTPFLAIFLIAGIMFSHGLWSNITLPTEIYPKNVQATLTGIGGSLGGITSFISQKLIGSSIGTYSYLPIFVYIGFAYLFTYFLVSILIGKLGVIRKL